MKLIAPEQTPLISGPDCLRSIIASHNLEAYVKITCAFCKTQMDSLNSRALSNDRVAHNYYCHECGAMCRIVTSHEGIEFEPPKGVAPPSNRHTASVVLVRSSRVVCALSAVGNSQAEVKTSARRLMRRLCELYVPNWSFLPNEAKEEKLDAEEAPLDDGIIQVCWVSVSFATNPTTQKHGTMS